MQIEVYKKLWVNCHLMYPNSSQARDIFSHLVTVSTKENLDSVAFLKTTFQTLTAVKAVKSGSNYFEYSEYTMDCWNSVLKKCQRREQFFLMSILFNKTSFSDLEKATDISENKIKYLINQAIKKVSDFSKDDHKFLSEDIQFKTHHEKKISKISLSEKIFEATLDFTTAREKVFILAEAEKYPDTKKIIESVKKLRQELDSIPKTETFLENIAAIEKNIESNEHDKKLNSKVKISAWKRIGLYFAITSFLAVCFLTAFNIRNEGPQIVVETLQIQRQQPKQTLVAAKNIEISYDKNKLVSAIVATKAPAIKVVYAASVATAIVENQANTTTDNTFKKKHTGVYRGTIDVVNLDEVTERVKSKIFSLSGFKAGEVELGWMKSLDTTYFHFIIPTENIEDLNQFIKQFGDFKYRFEKHPRVLNGDQKRFIIEVRKVE